MAECPLPKPNTRVRFPSSAPKRTRTPKRVRVLFSDRILNQNPLRILLFLCKSLDKSKKCAIIKIRGNTGDGYSLKLAEITANSWKVWAVISFCFAYRLPTLQLQVRKYPVEEDLPKLCTSGITSLRRTRRKKKKFLRPPVREEATATGRQCLHPTKSAVCKRFLPCVCRNKAICALLLGVSKVTDFSVALL